MKWVHVDVIEVSHGLPCEGPVIAGCDIADGELTRFVRGGAAVSELIFTAVLFLRDENYGGFGGRFSESGGTRFGSRLPLDSGSLPLWRGRRS